MPYGAQMSDIDFSGNLKRFTGFAGIYDGFRPAPPAGLGTLLTYIAQVDRPALVVDLGCGTGLSTHYWADKATSVIGIEPTQDMREKAQAQSLPNVSYCEGFSHATRLESQCAQIVTASQALHWMEPTGTFREVSRILAPGGVFAAYDYDWPPVTGVWEADQAYEECMEHCRLLESSHGIIDQVRRWDKSTHLRRMQESGCFRYVREVVLSHVDRGNDERILGLIQSQGHVKSLQKLGLSDEELGLDRLRHVTAQYLGSATRDFIWSSRVRLAVV